MNMTLIADRTLGSGSSLTRTAARLLAVFAGMAILSMPSRAGAQVLPCSPDVPGCQNGPFFYLIPSPGSPQAGVQTVLCTVIGCLTFPFVGTTGRDPGGLIAAKLRREIVGFPIPSPSGGFAFTFDRTTRTFARSTDSFGPTFGERATTQGRGQLSFGVGYQLHSYGSVVGADTLTASVTYLDGDAPLWTNQTSLRLTRHVIDGHATYGITNAIDVSFQVPFAFTSVDDVFEPGVPGRTPEQMVQTPGFGAGLGDAVAQVKVALGSQGRSSRFGLVGSVSLPTGDETKVNGLGYAQVKVAGVWSGMSHAWVQPHLNFGVILPLGTASSDFDINGTQFNLKPKQLETVVGCDLVVSPRLTLSLDVLARRELNSAVVQFGVVPPAIVTGILIDGIVQCCVNSEATYYPVATDPTNGIVSVGAKYNLHGQSLVSTDVVFSFGPYAIRPRPTLTIGFSTGF